MLPLIFVLPIIQLIILTFAADFELKVINYMYIDNDNSQESRKLIDRFRASTFFVEKGRVQDFKQGMSALDNNEAGLLITIPVDFSESLHKDKAAKIMVDVNSIDGQAATLSYSYATAIINDLQDDIRMEWNGMPNKITPPVSVESQYWYNTDMKYSILMAPGVLAILITMVGMFLSAMNLVREKEIGTIEQINVTPIKKHEFLLGKLIPFWLIAMFELGFGLLIAKIIFDIPIVGSLPLLFGFTAIFLLVVLGVGLWISTITETQQQAMFIAWFFIVIFILMSGLFTPIENMPGWAQELTRANPIAYMVKVIRAILIKGAGFADIKMEFVWVTGYAILVNTFALMSYSKRN
jgi:ABC-2 type transport system permease protein